MFSQPKRFILSLLFIIFSIALSAQKYPVYNFEAFTPMLKKHNDTTYVINFWATWCRPCVKEMPAFNNLQQEYKDNKIKIILVSLDFGNNLQSKIERFAQIHKIKSTIIILDDPDSNSWIDKVNSNWSGAIPATLIYNNNKRKFYEQSFTYEELKHTVNQFIMK